MTEAPTKTAKFGEFSGDHRPMMAMIEVTNRCNMDCPLCFSDANHPADDVPFPGTAGVFSFCASNNLYRFPERTGRSVA